MHSNCRGIKSKLQSINHIVNDLIVPDIVSLNEHWVSGRNKVNIYNYHSFTKKRENKRMGGVSLSVPKDNLHSYLKIKEGEGSDEYIIVRNRKYTPPLNIITLYGELESRSSKEETFNRWQRFLADLKKIEIRKENVIIASDINKKLGNDEYCIKDNHEEISYGGMLVRKLIASGEYGYANNTDKVEGGPFTRINPANEENKTLLDVIILSKSLVKFLDKLIIDDNFKFPVQYPVKEKDRIVFKRSDFTFVFEKHSHQHENKRFF